MPSREDERDSARGKGDVKTAQRTVVLEPGKRSLTDDLEPIPRRTAPRSGLLPATVQREAARSDAGSRPTLQSILEARRVLPHQDLAAQREPDPQDSAAGLHAAADQDIAEAGGPRPYLEPIQAFVGGHDVSHDQAHVRGTADTASRATGSGLQMRHASGAHVPIQMLAWTDLPVQRKADAERGPLHGSTWEQVDQVQLAPGQRPPDTHLDANAAVHAAAAQGISGPADKLPHPEQIQQSFGGHEVRHVQAHVGGPVAATLSWTYDSKPK